MLKFRDNLYLNYVDSVKNLKIDFLFAFTGGPGWTDSLKNLYKKSHATVPLIQEYVNNNSY
jgi:hypothetical protein